MVVLRFKTSEEKKEMLHKVKKMYKFAKELKECLEDKIEEEDDDEYYRMDEDYDDEMPRHRSSSTRRYRKSM